LDASEPSEEPIETKETGEVIHVPSGIYIGSALCGAQVRLNLILMTWVWISTQIDYFVINFNLKHMEGSVFLNFSLAGLAEILAHIFVGVTFNKMGPRATLMVGYTLTAFGSIPMIWQDRFGDGLIALFVIVAKFGISMSTCCSYVSTPILFPVHIASTAFGITNFVGRLFGMLAPIIAEWESPLPMEIVSVVAIISIFVSIPLTPYTGDLVDDYS
jgi:hypothetical protein